MAASSLLNAVWKREESTVAAAVAEGADSIDCEHSGDIVAAHADHAEQNAGKVLYAEFQALICSSFQARVIVHP